MRVLDGRNPNTVPYLTELKESEYIVLQIWSGYDGCHDTPVTIKCIKHQGYFVPLVYSSSGYPVLAANYKRLLGVTKWVNRNYDYAEIIYSSKDA